MTLAKKIPVGLAVLLLAASCGGGGVTPEEFAAKADPICARVGSELADLGQPQSPDELAGYLEGFVAITGSGLDDVRGLEAPDGDQDAFDEWVDTLEQITSRAEDALAATDAGDQDTSIAILGEVDQLNADANRQAGDLGLTDCAAS